MIEKDPDVILIKDKKGNTPADIAENIGFGDWDFLKQNEGDNIFSNTILFVCLLCGALLIFVR